MPSFVLKEVQSKPELDAIVELYWSAFRDPVRSEWWLMHIGPGCKDQAQAREADKERQWGWHKSSSGSSHWLYVTDEDTGRVIGCVEWQFHMQNPFGSRTRMALDHVEPGEARDFTEHIVNQIYAPRMSWVRRKHAGNVPSAPHAHKPLTCNDQLLT